MTGPVSWTPIRESSHSLRLNPQDQRRPHKNYLRFFSIRVSSHIIFRPLDTLFYDSVRHVNDVDETKSVSTGLVNVAGEYYALPKHPSAVFVLRKINILSVCVTKCLFEHQVWKPQKYVIDDKGAIRGNGGYEASNAGGETTNRIRLASLQTYWRNT